ncbi:MAG: hypothetical protein JWN48_3604 [Myxococcaceae bacterium]|nr:hypothetical protein [Myxococcaceae bacterium]
MSTDRVLALLRRHGREGVSFQALTAGCRHWFAEDAVVAYVDTGSAWVTVGSPVAAAGREPEVALEFADAARKARRRVRFFATEQAWPADSAFASHAIGEQPSWEPSAWPGQLPKKLHRQIRQHRARGRVGVRELAEAELVDARSPARRGIERLQSRWVAGLKMAPMGFLVQLNLYERAGERRYFVAEHQGQVVCAIVAMPVYARGGWLLETFMRDPAAPGGAMELVFDCALARFAAEGARYVSFGLCPLSGTGSWLHTLIRHSARGLYDFDGLRHFKSKLQPTAWSPVYLTYPRHELASVAVYDALSAFCPGGVLAFGTRTLWRALEPLARERRVLQSLAEPIAAAARVALRSAPAL